jgi:hypothetical protein
MSQRTNAAASWLFDMHQGQSISLKTSQDQRMLTNLPQTAANPAPTRT